VRFVGYLGGEEKSPDLPRRRPASRAVPPGGNVYRGGPTSAAPVLREPTAAVSTVGVLTEAGGLAASAGDLEAGLVGFSQAPPVRTQMGENLRRLVEEDIPGTP